MPQARSNYANRYIPEKTSLARHSVGWLSVICRQNLTGAGKSSFSLPHAPYSGAAVSVLRSHKGDWEPVPLGVAPVVDVASDGVAVFGARLGIGGIPGDMRCQTTAGENPAGVGAVSLPGCLRHVRGGVVCAINSEN